LKKRFKEGPSLSSSELISAILGRDVDDGEEPADGDYDRLDNNEEESTTGQVLFSDEAGDDNNMPANVYAKELAEKKISRYAFEERETEAACKN
jgi:hypothetical protein